MSGMWQGFCSYEWTQIDTCYDDTLFSTDLVLSNCHPVIARQSCGSMMNNMSSMELDV